MRIFRARHLIILIGAIIQYPLYYRQNASLVFSLLTPNQSSARSFLVPKSGVEFSQRIIQIYFTFSEYQRIDSTRPKSFVDFQALPLKDIGV